MESIEEQDAQQNRLEEAGLALELAALLVLVQRLKSIDQQTTYATARALESQDFAEIQRITQAAQETLAESAEGVLADMVEECEEYAAPYFAARGMDAPSIAEDLYLSNQLVHALENSTAEIAKACDSTAWALKTKEGLKPFRDAYRAYVDAAVQALARGESSYYAQIGAAVDEIAASGARVVYASGNSKELFSAFSQNVMDGYRDTMQGIRDEQAKRFGADGVRVSAHGLCAPDHLPYQGRAFSNERFAQIQKSLRRPIGMWNCKHMTSGVILGVSAETYSRADRAAMKAASERLTGVENAAGREMTAYEFSQWQRQRETAIRKLKFERALQEGAGEDTGGLDARIKAASADYRAKSKAAGVRTRPERMRMVELKIS